MDTWKLAVQLLSDESSAEGEVDLVSVYQRAAVAHEMLGRALLKGDPRLGHLKDGAPVLEQGDFSVGEVERGTRNHALLYITLAQLLSEWLDYDRGIYGAEAHLAKEEKIRSLLANLSRVFEPRKPDLEKLKRQMVRSHRSVRGVVGFGVGERSIKIYVESAEVSKSLPVQVQGVTVEVVVVGGVKAL